MRGGELRDGQVLVVELDTLLALTFAAPQTRLGKVPASLRGGKGGLRGRGGGQGLQFL